METDVACRTRREDVRWDGGSERCRFSGLILSMLMMLMMLMTMMDRSVGGWMDGWRVDCPVAIAVYGCLGEEAWRDVPNPPWPPDRRTDREKKEALSPSRSLFCFLGPLSWGPCPHVVLRLLRCRSLSSSLSSSSSSSSSSACQALSLVCRLISDRPPTHSVSFSLPKRRTSNTAIQML